MTVCGIQCGRGAAAMAAYKTPARGYCAWAGFLRIPARTRTTNKPHFIWRVKFRQDLKITLKFINLPVAWSTG
jgi:hypothetical protein